MLNKRGQLTIIIIIGVLIVVGIIGYVVVSNPTETNPKTSSFENQAETAKESLTSCFTEISSDSLGYIGIQGGYYAEPLTVYYKTFNYNIPFYYFGELNYIPSIDVIEENIESTIDSKKAECLNLLSDYDFEYDYNYNMPDAKIDNEDIIITNNIELTFTKDNSTKKINFANYPIHLKSSIKEMNALGAYIAYSYQTNNENLCLSCFLEIASDKNLYVEITDDLDGLLQVRILDNRTDYFPLEYDFMMSHFKEQQGVSLLPENYSKTIYSQENNTQELNIIAPQYTE